MFVYGFPKIWLGLLFTHVHTCVNKFSMSHGSLSLLCMMKVMVSHFEHGTHKATNALNLVLLVLVWFCQNGQNASFQSVILQFSNTVRNSILLGLKNVLDTKCIQDACIWK